MITRNTLDLGTLKAEDPPAGPKSTPLFETSHDSVSISVEAEGDGERRTADPSTITRL